MEVKFLSSNDQYEFGDLLHEKSEAASMFARLTTLMETETDYDQVMVSLVDDETIRLVVEDSPFVIYLHGTQETMTLYRNLDSADGELTLSEIEEWDLDDEGVEECVDYMASAVFGEEEDALEYG